MNDPRAQTQSTTLSNAAALPSPKVASAIHASDALRNRKANPLRFERRREQRAPVSPAGAPAQVSATYSDHAARFGIAHLEIVDQSPSGLGATTRTRLDPGMTITICPPGSNIPWIAATAVRCDVADEPGLFRVGLSLQRRRAA